MMDPYGGNIRSLLGGNASASRSDRESGCVRRNLRGECANPNLTGEYGSMSWREYDEIKSRGEDPEEVSFNNRHKHKPWLGSFRRPPQKFQT